MGQTYPWWALWLDPREGVSMRQAVRELLSDLPLSQQELAAEIGVDPSTVSRWVAGRTVPSLPELRAVLQVLQSRLARLRAQVEWGGQLLDALDVVMGKRRGGSRQQAHKKVHELMANSDTMRTGRGSRKRE